MSKSSGKGGSWDSFFDNPFGGLFDFNNDSKEDFGEQFLGYKILEDSTKTGSSHSSGLDLGLDSEDSGWRDTAEDGAEFGVFPEDYDSEEEYEDALQEAKYGWRDTVEDGLEFEVDPENYETEEEYEDALQEAKYGWRDTVEDGLEFGVDPENYETEEEYEDALQEAKYGWRDTVEDGLEFGVDPENYETEEEYEDALKEAKYGWRDTAEDGLEYGVDPEDYETEEEYDAAWQQRRDEAQEKEREKREEYRRAIQEKREQELAERRAARKELEAALLQDKTIYTCCGVKLPYALRPYSFRTEDESIEIGDTVVVPVGEDNKEVEGTVVSVGRYARAGVPYPVEKTKFIIRKIDGGKV